MKTPRLFDRRLVLTMLLLAYVLNFLDRQILGILAGPIKAELALSDAQLGLMGGLAFALLYTGLGIPLAWVADRFSRAWLMTSALVVWSGFSAACGLAGNFWQLFLARMGVGVGEAGGVAPAYALISELFPAERRARALAIYSLGIPIGSGLGILLGGWISHVIDWRAAFILLGLAGVVFAPVFKFVVRDPPRLPDPPTTLTGGLAPLLRKRSFWLVASGAASAAACGFGTAFWLPSFLERSFALDLIDRSVFLGAVTLVGGTIGVLSGGWLGDRLGHGRPAAYLVVPGAAMLLALPSFIMAMRAESLTAAFMLFLIPTALNLIAPGPLTTVVQHLAPAGQRSMASAAFLFVNNLVGMGIGTWLFGLLSDLLTPHYGAEALRYALYAGLSFYLVSAALFLLAARTLDRDWVA